MAWTAPSATDYAVAEVVTAAKLNSNVANNLRYLKGTDGPVSIDNTIASLIAAGGASVEAQGTSNNSNARFRLLAKQSGGTVVDYRIFANALSADGELAIYDATAAAERLRITSAGFVGINQASPAGRFQVNDVESGILFWRNAAVAGTIVPVLAAGSVAGSLSGFYVCYDGTQRTAGALTGVNAATLAANFNLQTSTGTYTLHLNANGSVDVQRTAGTGTAKICLWLLYQ